MGARVECCGADGPCQCLSSGRQNLADQNLPIPPGCNRIRRFPQGEAVLPRHKLIAIDPRGAQAQRLQQALLEYHDFRGTREAGPLREQIDELGQWQAQRLKQTHDDLYRSPQYRQGLNFLLEDLYNPRAFTQRDEDFERVFPTMVRLLPESALRIVADLVELNLLTQQLDRQLVQVLHSEMGAPLLDRHTYAEAFRRCGNPEQRWQQVRLVAGIGKGLQRYVDSRSLRLALTMTERAAEMAGVGELHHFLTRGFRVFREMKGVDNLLDKIVCRESWVLEQILAGHSLPDCLPERLPSVPSG